MPEAEEATVTLGTSYALLAAASLPLGVAAGYVMHRSDFCLAGMFRDVFLFRRADMLRILLLLVLLSMALFEGARLLGLLVVYPFPFLYAPSAANLAGGALFGVGMVLAGGCVVGSLYKAGAGSVASAVAILGLVLGSTVYAEFHPLWKAFASATTFLPGRVTLPQALGVAPTVLVVPTLAAGALVLLRWARRGVMVRRSAAEGYLQPWKAAVALAVIGLLSVLFVGMPLGVTSSYTKIGAIIEEEVAPGHVARSAYFQGVPLHYVQPITGVPLEGGVGPRFDALSAIQFPLVIGIILGSALSAALLRELRPSPRLPARQVLSALGGGTIMGLASRMAPTCNVWHLMGGLPILSMSSILFLGGLLPGAWLGSRLLATLVIARPSPARTR